MGGVQGHGHADHADGVLLQRDRIAALAAAFDLFAQGAGVGDGALGEAGPWAAREIGVEGFGLHLRQEDLAAGETVQRHALTFLRGEAQVVGGQHQLQHLDLVVLADEQA